MMQLKLAVENSRKSYRTRIGEQYGCYSRIFTVNLVDEKTLTWRNMSLLKIYLFNFWKAFSSIPVSCNFASAWRLWLVLYFWRKQYHYFCYSLFSFHHCWFGIFSKIYILLSSNNIHIYKIACFITEYDFRSNIVFTIIKWF